MRLSLAAWATTMLGVVAPLLTISRSVPQATRVVRSGADGVSSATWVILVALAELWAIYGILARVPAEIVTNVPNGALCLLVVLLVAWRRATMRTYILVLSTLSAAIVAFAVACAVEREYNVEAIVAVVGSLGLCVPQLRRSLTDKELSGLSPASWAINTLAAMSWMVYGLAIAKIPIYLPCAVTIPISFTIALRAWSHRRRSTHGPGGCGVEPAQARPLLPGLETVP
jgi:uncharacterized protein with PQ loop repeat